MDYKKEYEAMVQRVKELHETGNFLTKKQMEIICPELAESEDGRIREDLIGGLMWQRDNLECNGQHDNSNILPGFCFSVGEHLAYLEKQKDNPKSADSIPSDCVSDAKFENRWHEVADSLPDNGREVLAKDQFGNTLLARYDGEGWDVSVYDDEDYRCHNGISKWREIPSEKQNEQKPDEIDGKALLHVSNKSYDIGFRDGVASVKPAEWSEDYREEDIQTRFAFYTYKDDPSVLYLSNVFVEEASRNHGFGTRILVAAEKVAETVGAITISLKVKQDSPANAWYRKNGYGYVAFEDGYDWLEKNLEYLKPKKEVEWSEEDERMRNQLIYDVEYHKKEGLISAKQNKATKALYNGIEKCYDEKIAWLKSLHPQPHTVSVKDATKFYERGVQDGIQSEKSHQWKPSEEQIEAMEYVIRDYREDGCNATANHLQEILDHLKNM